MQKKIPIWITVLFIGLFTLSVSNATVFAMGGKQKKEIKVEEETQENENTTNQDFGYSQDENNDSEDQTETDDTGNTQDENDESEDNTQNDSSDEDTDSSYDSSESEESEDSDHSSYE